jgi:hypothetical protein
MINNKLENMVVEEMMMIIVVSTLFLIFKACNVLIYNILLNLLDS